LIDVNIGKASAQGMLPVAYSRRVALVVECMNELARRYRENKAEIATLRWQLSVVRKPVGQ
jgi:hypothetical protein